MLAEQLEDRRLLAVDYGDAPDAGPGVAAGDYQTTFNDDGPAHVIVPGLRLGGLVDGDPRTQQGSGAEADDHTTVVADLAGDYGAGIDPASLSAGQSFSPDAAGNGQWEYLVSERPNPNDVNANLQSMVWDTGMNAFEEPTSSHTDGSNGFYIGFPSGDELAFRPHAFAVNRRPVARWIAGPGDAGEVTLEGRVRKIATGPSDGIRLLIYVDGTSVLEQSIAGEDGRGVAFTLPGMTVGEGTIVDVVIDANSQSDLDTTGVSLTITRGDDEDGVAEGTLEDFDLLPGRSPEISLIATNETPDDGMLAGWIDYNRDGVFDNASERATATVPAGSTGATVTLVFPEPPGDAVYTTYARFRLSTDAGFVVDPQPIGMVASGEVEDYLIGRPTRVWDGEGGDNDVFNSANWALETADGERVNSNRVPISTDDVAIPSAFADQTLVIQTTRSDRFRVRSIRSAAPLLVRDKGLFEVSHDSHIAALTLDGIRTDFGDSLQGSGAKLTIDGDLTWNEAQISRVTIDVGGNLIIDSDRPKSLLSSLIRAHGDGSVWSSGDIQASGSSLYNHGTFTTASHADSLRPGPFSPAATFVNVAGATWIHDAPAPGDEEADLFGRFYNNGTLQVRQGRLAIGDCCTRLTHKGAFLVSPDAQLTIRSVATFAPASSLVAGSGSTVVIETSNNVVSGTFDVEGTLVVEGGVTFQTAVTVPNLIFDGSSIVTTKPLTATDEFQWLRGTLQGDPFTSQGTMTLGAADDASGMTLRARLINEGQATWLGRNLAYDGGVIQNDGTFLDASDGIMAIAVFRDGVVENNGTWTIADTVGRGGRAQRDARFLNQGQFEIGRSDVRIFRLAQADGTLLLGGGTLEVSGEDLLISGGTLAGGGHIITDVQQSGGTISPGQSPGILNIDGNLEATGGQLLVEIAGPPIDDNEQDAVGVNFDRLNVSGSADVAHLQVELLEDYQPTLSSRYLVLQANSLTGPTSDNTADVLMTIPASDAVVELVVTSEPNTPPTAEAGGPYRGDEGADVTFDASATSDAEQAADSLTYEWDFDYDGVTFDADATGRSVIRAFANQFGPRSVAVRVSDSGQLSDLATTTLQIDNVPPEFVTSMTGAPAMTIDANNVATLTGQFIDPGADDGHSLEIQWGDGVFERVDLGIGQRAFELTHTYAANQTGAPRDFTVQLAVYDETESSDATSLTLTQPFINQPPVADAGGPYTALEGTQFTLNASGSRDPNQPADSLTYHWDLDYDGRTFDAEYFGPQILLTIENNLDQPLPVAVRVTDTQGLFDIASTTITVDNVPPDMRGFLGIPRLSASIDDMYLATLSGQFTDPGSDTQTVMIDWGDGTPTTELSLSNTERQFTATHPYPIPDDSIDYVIAVTVTDQDGSSDSAATSLTVNEPLATLSGEKFEDLDGDAVRDTDESGLSGWTIELLDEATGQLVQTTVTAADGSYEFAEVPRGTYLIREVQQLGWRQTAPIDPVRRISIDAGGIESDGQSDSPTISADGRYVAFSSLASNLVPDDTNGLRDIFVKDTVTGAIERVSIPLGGGQADGPSYTPAISGDGNIIAFRSLAENLVQDDRNVASDIFVHDRRSGVTRRVSVNLDLDEGDEDSYAPSISADGRYVAYQSTASNLVPGDTNGLADVFVTDLFTGLTQRVSVASDGRQADHESYQPSISADGRYVAFTSASQSFDDRDRDVDLDVYVYDRLRDQLSLISRTFAGRGGDGDSFDPTISGDGTTVAFASSAGDLFPGDVNNKIDLFVADLASGGVRRITLGDGPSSRPSLDFDGSHVLFVSHASNLVVGDTNYGPDVFLYDRDLDSLSMVGQRADELSAHLTVTAVISDDASAIALASDARDLVPDDGNWQRDIFVQQLVGVHRVEVNGIAQIDGLDFGNQFRLASIQGQKFADENGNGQRDVDPQTGAFVEPGLDGWTIRLVDQRTGQTWETVTASVDLDGDGSIDPMTETGLYEFGPLEPGRYELYELTQSGWIPTLPAPLAPRPIPQAPVDPQGRPPFTGPDPRIFVPPTPRTPPQNDPSVSSVPAVAPGQSEQLPILYLHGIYEDGSAWGDYGEYFRTLADVTDGGPVVEGSAGVETFAIQFASDAVRDRLATSEEGVALLRSLDELQQQSSIPLLSYINSITDGVDDLFGSVSLNPLETAANTQEAINNLLNTVADPVSNAVADCGLAVSECFLNSVVGQVETATYNQHGRVEHRAVDLKDLIVEEIAAGGSRLPDVSQVNFLTHGDGALDVRAMLALIKDAQDQSVRDSVANVIYAGPTFGGTVAAELDTAFFASPTLEQFVTNPWVQSVLANNTGGELEAKFYDGAFEAYLRTHLTAILDAAFDRDEHDSFEELVQNIPSPNEIEARVGAIITALDDAFAAATGGFRLADVDALLSLGSPGSTFGIELVVKAFISLVTGSPGTPRGSVDLRPYEAVQDNLNRYAANPDVNQFVVWGESVPPPANPTDFSAFSNALAPPLADAAADPRNLHAFGSRGRAGTTFLNMDIVPGDGVVSRTSALLLTDLAGGYMKALAGFDNHSHATLNANMLSESSSVFGSFLSNDDDATASLGEVYVETLLTPVTSLQFSTEATVQDAEARQFLVDGPSTVSFRPEGREFQDVFGRRFSVEAAEVEYRVVSDPSSAHPRVGSWRSADPDDFSISFAELADEADAANEQPFALQWRSVNQQGGREAIRSAVFRVDTAAPSLQRVDVVDAELSGDLSQIARPGLVEARALFGSERIASQLNDATLERFLTARTPEFLVSLDRDKTIRFQFDSPVSVEYAWNDPLLSNPRTTTLGDLEGGTAEFLIKQRIPGNLQFGAGGIDFLLPGTHTLYYRSEDPGGNQSTVQSLTILVDTESPLLTFNVGDGQFVGPATPLSVTATDTGAGIELASIDVPGVGSLSTGTVFALGETLLHEAVDSGASVSLAATATDRVGNATSESLSVHYDYLTPEIEVVSLSDSTRLFDGRYVTTSPNVELVAAFSDDASGVDAESLRWAVSNASSPLFAGTAFQMDAAGEYSATVRLNEGYNYVTLQASDAVGNSVSQLLTVILAAGHDITVHRGDRLSGVNFGNVSLSTLAGQVFEDRNADGSRDANEPGLAGVTVYLDQNDNGILDSIEPRAISDVEGEYRFGGVVPGNHIVREVVPEVWQLTAPGGGAYRVSTGFGEQLQGLDFGNFLPATLLGGLVYEDLDGNGVQDSGETGIEDQKIGLDINADGSIDRVTTTDSDGRYQFDGIAPGSFIVQWIGRQGWQVSTGTSYSLSLSDGEVVEDLDFGAFRPVTASGVVFADLNGNGQREFFEATVSDVTVRVDLDKDGSVDFETTSQAEGFSFSNLPPGTYFLASVPQDGFQQTSPLGSSGYLITVVSGDVITSLDFGIFNSADGDPTATISGLVFDDLNANGLPDPSEPTRTRAAVRLYEDGQGSPVATATTNDSGRYTFTILSQTAYQLRTDLPDGFVLTTSGSDSIDVNVQAGQSIDDVHFGIFGEASISGVVFDDANGNGRRDDGEKPIEQAVVEVIDGSTGNLETTTTDEDGSYQFLVARGNRYTVTSQPQAGSVVSVPGSGQYTIISDDSPLVTNADFGHFEGTRIAGQVFDDRNSNQMQDPGELGVDGQTIEIVEKTSGAVVAMQSTGQIDLDGDGVIEFAAESGVFDFVLPAGDYRARIVPQTNWPPTTDPAIIVDSGPGIHTDLQFGVLGLSRLRGVAFVDANGNGVRESEEPALIGQTIELHSASGRLLTSTVTDDQGEYEFAVTADRQYEITSQPAAGAFWTTPSRSVSYQVTAVLDQTLTGFDFGQFERVRLSGLVFDDIDENGNPSVPGASVAVNDGIANWTVLLDLGSDGTFDEITATDGAGRYEFVGIGPGQHTIAQSRPERWQRTAPVIGQYVVQAVSGQDVDELDFGNTYVFGAIIGQHFNDLDRDYRDDFDQPGANGLRVEVVDRSSGEVVASQLTESIDLNGDGQIDSITEAGLYRFDLPAGDYEVRSVPNPGWQLTYPLGLPRTLTVNAEGEVGDLVGTLEFGRGQRVTRIRDLSRDSRYVLFSTPMDNLVPSDTNQAVDLFVADLFDGSIQRVSVDESGAEAQPNENGYLQTHGGLFSPDGRYIAYGTDAKNIAIDLPDSVNGEEIIYDWQGGSLIRTGLYNVNVRDLTDDYLVYYRPNGNSGLYYYDIDSKTSQAIITRDSGGFSRDTGNINVSDDARWITFSTPLAYVPEDTNQNVDVYLYDRQNASYELVSRRSDGTASDDEFVRYIAACDDPNHEPAPGDPPPNCDRDNAARASFPQISPDGRYVVFESTYRDLVPGDINGPDGDFYFFADNDPQADSGKDVFLYDRVAQSLEIISVNDDGEQANRPSSTDKFVNSTILQDGRYISFRSYATNLGADVASPQLNTFLLDRESGHVRRLGSPGVVTEDTETFIYLEYVENPSVRNLVRQRLNQPVTYPVTLQARQTISGLNFGSFDLGGSDFDGDGVPRSVEDAAPGGGDGNDDGVPDRDQPHVASLPNAVDGTYVTVVAPEGTQLINVTAIENPDPTSSPKDVEFPVGFINYELHGIAIGGRVDVDLYFANNARLTSYYKYGPTPDNPEPHFYEFRRTGDYGVRSLRRGRVTLRFTDGLTGDDDLTANGIIVDPGVPVADVAGPMRNPVDPTDVNNDEQTTALDALVVINYVGRIGDSTPVTSTEGDFMFLDVNGDTRVTSIDALQVINAIGKTTPPVEAEASPSVAASPLDPELVDAVIAEPRSHIEPNQIDLGSRGHVAARESGTRRRTVLSATAPTSITASQDDPSELEKTLDLLTIEDPIRIDNQ